MLTTDLIHRAPVDWPTRPTFERPALAPSFHELIAPVRNAILRARHAIEDEQRPDGSWLARGCGESSLAPQLVLLLAFLDRESTELAEQAAAAIRNDQRADGLWSRSPSASGDVSVSVAAYFALKIMGDDPTEPHMARAREAIRNLGGADAADSPTRMWLALLGQIDFDCCDPIAPEWLLLPESWQRRVKGQTIDVAERRRRIAMSLVWSLRPRRAIELARGVRELFVALPEKWSTMNAVVGRWSRLWATLTSWCERSGIVPLRKSALATAEEFIAHNAALAEVNELGFDELIWHIVALHAVGYSDDCEACMVCESRLHELLVVEHDDTLRPASTTSEMNDTVRAIGALAASGVDSSQPSVANGAAWLVDRLTTTKLAPAANLLLLQSVFAELIQPLETNDVMPPGLQMSRDRLARFVARQRHRQVPLERMRHHMEQLRDTNLAAINGCQSVSEISTAIESLVKSGVAADNPAIMAAAARVRSQQRADGAWNGENADANVEVTARAVRGLIAAGMAPTDFPIAAAVNWLRVHQHQGGNWGGVRETASAVLALTAADAADLDATRRGIAWLVEQFEQSTSDDETADLHQTAITLHVLARWIVAASVDHEDPTPTTLRLVGELALAH